MVSIAVLPTAWQWGLTMSKGRPDAPRRCSTRNTSVLLLEDLLKQHNALPDLDRLVHLGCDRAQIIARLLNIQNPPAFIAPDPEAVFTISRRQVAAFQRRIWRIAGEMEAVFGQEYRAFLQSVLNDAETLHTPAVVRRFAGSLDFALSIADQKSTALADLLKRNLVAYVEHRAGRPCDQEVSALVNAVTGAAPSAEEQRKWRERIIGKPFPPARPFPPGSKKTRK
jgi:hypothetical protein